MQFFLLRRIFIVLPKVILELKKSNYPEKCELLLYAGEIEIQNHFMNNPKLKKRNSLHDKGSPLYNLFALRDSFFKSFLGGQKIYGNMEI